MAKEHKLSTRDTKIYENTNTLQGDLQRTHKAAYSKLQDKLHGHSVPNSTSDNPPQIFADLPNCLSTIPSDIICTGGERIMIDNRLTDSLYEIDYGRT